MTIVVLQKGERMELIDKEALINEFDDKCVGECCCCKFDFHGNCELIHNAPIVKLVRCKECKHYMLTSCPMTSTWATDEDYCSFGEKRGG